jgi:signal transduction histidine kinase
MGVASKPSATLRVVSDDRLRPAPVQVYDALDTATRAIAGLVSVDEGLQVIVDQVRPLVRARYAALGIVDRNGVIERFITSGIDDETRAGIGPLPRGHGFLGLIIRENESFRIPDIANDPRRYGFPPHHPPMHSFLGVPVTVKGRSVGNLYLTDKADGQEFTRSDQELVETFARHAAIAIENARLHEQVQRLAVFDERERIGRDLHDGIIQSIYAVGLTLEDVPELMDEDPAEVVRRVERAIESLHLTIRDIRNFIFGLRPELLQATTLEVGLAVIGEEFRHNSMIDVELQSSELDREPPADVIAHVLGVVNEALSNIARHSGASRALIVVGTDDDGRVRIAVTDNGRGFDSATATSLGHQGLANMRSRAVDIGATITIDSGAGGTVVTIVLPTREAAAAIPSVQA